MRGSLLRPSVCRRAMQNRPRGAPQSRSQVSRMSSAPGHVSTGANRWRCGCKARTRRACPSASERTTGAGRPGASGAKGAGDEFDRYATASSISAVHLVLPTEHGAIIDLLKSAAFLHEAFDLADEQDQRRRNRVARHARPAKALAAPGPRVTKHMTGLARRLAISVRHHRGAAFVTANRQLRFRCRKSSVENRKDSFRPERRTHGRRR